MPANTSPIFPLVPVIAWALLLTANTAKDGTGTAPVIFTAGANGSRVDQIKVRNTGSAIATVLRIFINNGSTPATATNNSLYMERTIPSATLSEVAELLDIIIPLNLTLPAGYKLLATIGTTIATALQVTAEGGDY